MIFAVLLLFCQNVMFCPITDVATDLAAAADVDIVRGLTALKSCFCCLSDVMCSSLLTVLFKFPLRDE